MTDAILIPVGMVLTALLADVLIVLLAQALGIK